MQKINEFLLDILYYLSIQKKEESTPYLKTISKQAVLFSGEKKLLTITDSKILLAGTNIQPRIDVPANQNETFDLENIDKLKQFYFLVKNDLVRLNHLGINYLNFQPDEEIGDYQNMVRESGLKIYEEESPLVHERWIFIGNLDYWEHPLFEITLVSRRSRDDRIWRPHFQIDVDINLKYADIVKIVRKVFGKNIFKYQVDVPQGTVFGIGPVCSVDGIKICLGVGTIDRITEYHRKRMLKPLTA